MMNESPYRAATLPAARPIPPVEHVYVARERDVNAAFHRVWIRTMLFGVGGGVIAAAVVSPAAAWLVIAGVLAWSIASWRRTRKGDAIVFRVEHGQLTVMRRGSAHPLLPPLPLSSVLDVTLDSKSITPVTRDTSISAVAPQMKIRGEVDISRIVLVPAAPREPVAITEEHVAHMDAIEGAGRIRSFLRAHDWLPQDERGRTKPAA
ncbi:MAG: hypothetical protein ACLQVI_19995 [Polyangiaceae bacterium]